METDLMKTLISKATSTASAAFAIAIACVLAGLGLAALFYLALLGLTVIGFGLLAAPFVAMMQKRTARDLPNDTVSAS
jgi:hypothetical protein